MSFFVNGCAKTNCIYTAFILCLHIAPCLSVCSLVSHLKDSLKEGYCSEPATTVCSASQGNSGAIQKVGALSGEES